jgi:UDP-N-acetylmuramoyl-L-alanyl-D-glutamate--2,6-diaminopimelate ligase
VKLSELSAELPGSHLSGPDAEVTGICYDSRGTRAGELFVAVPGLQTDGTAFVKDALARGAAAVLCGDRAEFSAGLSALRVPNVRKGMAEAAWALSGHPERELIITAITGTNGKTTTAALLRQLLRGAGIETGLIGTLGAEFGTTLISGVRTTPEAIDLASTMRTMCDHKITHVVLEATSIGIDLERLWKLPVRVAVFTNLTRDHLDYHGTETAYLAAKERLFSERARDDFCVINVVDPAAAQLVSAAQGRVLTYGIECGDVQARDVRLSASGTTFNLRHAGRAHLISAPLLGRFNVSNILAAIASALCLGVSEETAAATLRTAQAARGRAEVVVSPAPFTVIVDFAHTPDALEKILRMVREFQPTELITVFGAGGDRDRGKRPLMGQVASVYSTLTIVTSDNPRGEEPAAIMREIKTGITATANYVMIEDRRAAIGHALRIASPGSAVVIAGQGHETDQEIAGVKYPFDDVEVAQAILRELGYA